MSRDHAVESLIELGLTRVEAEVYVYLCQNPPATGYAIAAAINRTKGAIYSVLESLAEKGAVEADEGRAKQFRATPPAEFLQRMTKRLDRARQRAQDSIEALQPDVTDNRIYSLATVQQVYDRCRSMLAGCRKVALVDSFPVPLERLIPDLRTAAGRGVRIWSQSYDDTPEIPDTKAALSPLRGELLDRLRHQWITLCVDGTEHLIAVLDQKGERVHYACWSPNLLLSWILFSYVKPHLLGTRIQAMIEAGASNEELRREQDEWLAHMPEFTSPGFELVQRLFGNKDDDD